MNPVDASSLLAGESEPPSRLAVTVVVARPVANLDGAYEVLLSERGRGAFARGLWVFPGGCVDEDDAHILYDLDASVVCIADRFGITTVRASALVVGALRELAEEAAIVRPGPLARTLTVAEWQSARGGAFIFEPPSGPIWALSRWLPPRIERRRFDTFFLVTEVPAGLVARADGDELLAHRWLTPTAALEEFRLETLPLVPPTFRTLVELSAFDTLAKLRAALAVHWPPVNSPMVRAAAATEGPAGAGWVSEFSPDVRPGLDGQRAEPFYYDGQRWTPVEPATKAAQQK